MFVLSKIGLLDLIFFNFTIDNFCCWANFFELVYFVLNFKFIDFFVVFKKKKNARATFFFFFFFYKLVMWQVVIDK